ncbi:tape measure protein, partial [Lactococcus lactis subsp. lactis]
DIKSKFTGALEAGVEYNKEMQNLSVSLNNFTNGNQKLNDSLVDNIKNLREESGYSIDTLSLLTKKTYGLTGSADGAKKLSDAFVNLGRATGKSDDAMQNIITKFTQMNASGEITSGSITKMEKTLPGFAKTLATTMGVSRDKLNELAKDGKISMSDLSKTIENMSAAKPKGLENYLTSFDGFSGHLKEKYQSLSGKITEGFFKTNNNFLKNMSKSLDGKETEKAFTHIGDSANKAVTTISKAFSSVFKGTKNPLADFANGLANKIEKLGNFISKHANDIKNFFGMVKNLGGTAFKLIGDTLKTVIPWLEKFGTWASKHPEDVKKIALAIIGLNVALKGTLGVLKGVEKFKEAKKLVLGFGSSIKKTATGMKLAFNFLKANPFILIITGIVAVVAAFVELYKHNKKFRNFINGIAKAVSKWAGSVVKWFKKTWNGVSKGFKNFGESFSKVFNSLLNGIKNAWNSAWSWIGNVFNKYIDVFKSVLKLFTDFFTGKWGNLGKDIHKIWDALWGFVESIFGKKVDSIKKGIEGFGTKIWDTFNTIKTKVSDFWKGMWDGLVQFGKDGINSVIGVINNGIGGINGVIHTFGGSKNAI